MIDPAKLPRADRRRAKHEDKLKHKQPKRPPSRADQRKAKQKRKTAEAHRKMNRGKFA